MTIPADLRQALAERYDLLRVLGKGGMATVYLATDRKLGRDIAIKVLRNDLAATLGTDRFLKEIQIAARLSHPHVLAMHESGEADGVLYYVMPFVDGPNLRQILEKERRLDPEAALAIAAPVADALSYAHRMGIFHRDIKPENILFQQGHPVVADFGIAKAVQTAGGRNLTRTGFPLGTPGYMSPEQAAGLADLDEKTDVYSLAILIYEMMVGDLPGGWPMDDAVTAGKFLEAPASHRAYLAQMGERVEGALIRAMALRTSQRTKTPQALMDDLCGPSSTAVTAAPRMRFNDEQVREIVRRASEMEAGLESDPISTSYQLPATSSGLTIGGVRALADEVGLGRDYVDRAASEIRTPGGGTLALEMPKDNRLIGGPMRILYERYIDGEVPDTEFPMLVDEVRLLLRNVGTVSQLGRSFSWSSLRSQGSTGRAIEITVTVRGGRTRIIVQELLGPLVGVIYGAVGGGMGGGGMGPIMGGLIGGGVLVPVAAALVVPMWLVLTYSVARTSYSYMTKKRKKELEGLADRLAAMARDCVPRRPRLGAPLRT